MTKPTDSIHASATQPRFDRHENRQTLCIGLRLWGFDEREAQRWTTLLRQLDGSVAWTIVRDRSASGADIVVHLVKPSTQRRASFCWNALGASYAISNSLSACGTEIALFMGNEDELPEKRPGHWAVAGSLSPLSALGRLGRMLLACCARQPDEAPTVRHDLLGLIASRLDAA